MLIRGDFVGEGGGMCLLELIARHDPDFAGEASAGAALARYLGVDRVISEWDSGSRRIAAQLLRMLRRERFYRRPRPARPRRRTLQVCR